MMMNTGCFPAIGHAMHCERWRRILLVAPSRTPGESFGAAGWRILSGENEDTYRLMWAHMFRGAMDVPLDAVDGVVDEVVRQVPLKSWVVYQEAMAGADLASTLPGVKCPAFVSVTGQRHIRKPALDVAALLPDVKVLVHGNAYHTPASGATFRRLMESREAGMAAAENAVLTRRELDVLRLMAEGRTNPQIAGELVLTVATVATHVRHILEKTGSANRAEAAVWAARNGLV